MNDPDESELISRCRAGAAMAWDELLQRHYAATASFVFQLSPDFSREDVEDVCEEVFITVVRTLDSFRGDSRFQTWLFRIAANKAKDFRERQRAAKRGGGQQPLPLSSDDPDNALAADPPSADPGPDGALMKAEQSALLRLALDQLGESCREIVELRYFGDLSYEELANTLGLNPKTVSSRLSKCLNRLELIAREVFARKESHRFSV
jgi:RNA polymerase sigma-70 factor (ECF subfamily)